MPIRQPSGYLTVFEQLVHLREQSWMSVVSEPGNSLVLDFPNIGPGNYFGSPIVANWSFSLEHLRNRRSPWVHRRRDSLLRRENEPRPSRDSLVAAPWVSASTRYNLPTQRNATVRGRCRDWGVEDEWRTPSWQSVRTSPCTRKLYRRCLHATPETLRFPWGIPRLPNHHQDRSPLSR